MTETRAQLYTTYLRKAGSYENPREFERDHLITDKSGYTKTKLLPYGVYVLEQTVGKDGFEIKKPLLFEITGEENPIQPPILTLNDRPILYRLRLIKTDARTGKPVTLAGASFKLKDAEGNTVTQTVYYPKKQTLDTFTTDESGCVTLPEEVGWRLYSIEEIQAPEGYLIRTESLPVFVGKTGDTADQVYELDIEIPNEAVMGQISLEKKGFQLVGFESKTEMGFEYQSPVFEERCLADAVFEVCAAEEIVGGDGTVWYQKDELVDTITTSGTGTDWSKELPLGKYKLMEIAAPEGYALSDEVYEVELKSIDGHTPLVTVTVKAHNEYLSTEIQLEKEKEILKPYTDEDGYIRQELTTTYGLGFVFGLYNADDIHYADGTAYYLKHSFTGSTSSLGTPFATGDTSFNQPSRNIAIYGHNIRSKPTVMFSPLLSYKKAEFYQAHRTIHLDTLNGAYIYKVFAAFNMRYDDFAPEKADFETEDDFAHFMDFVKSASLHENDMTVTGGDHLLTLITCDRTYSGADGRFVVMAVREN